MMTVLCAEVRPSCESAEEGVEAEEFELSQLEDDELFLVVDSLLSRQEAPGAAGRLSCE
jgi:hypothetical protein